MYYKVIDLKKTEHYPNIYNFYSDKAFLKKINFFHFLLFSDLSLVNNFFRPETLLSVLDKTSIITDKSLISEDELKSIQKLKIDFFCDDVGFVNVFKGYEILYTTLFSKNCFL